MLTVPAIMKALPRLAVLCDYPEEGWPSNTPGRAMTAYQAVEHVPDPPGSVGRNAYLGFFEVILESP